MVTKNGWDEQSIERLLLNRDDAVIAGLICIYERQTAAEKASKTTAVENGVGFNKYDSVFMSSLAEYYKKHNYLTPKQLTHARKNLLKYRKQLLDVASNSTVKGPFFKDGLEWGSKSGMVEHI